MTALSEEYLAVFGWILVEFFGVKLSKLIRIILKMAARGPWKLRPRNDGASESNVSKLPTKSIGTSLTKLIKSPFKRPKPVMETFEADPGMGSDDLKKGKVTGVNKVPDPNAPSLPPPPVFTLQTQDKNSLMIIDAINTLQATLVESHLNLERKLDNRLCSVEDQLQSLNTKFQDQDRAIRDRHK